VSYIIVSEPGPGKFTSYVPQILQQHLIRPAVSIKTAGLLPEEIARR